MKIIINKSYIIYFLVLIYFKSAVAYENPNQFKVEADKSIEYFEKQKIYIASGNAKASKGNLSVKADNITAFMGKTKNSDITNIEANGNVIIIDQDTIAKSNFAKYNFKEKIIILTGNTQSIEAKTFKLQSTKITSNYGYIINNYTKFKLDKNVNIYNKEKKFVLNSEELLGTFDTGEMYTNSPVKIQIKNSKIQGSSLSLKNYGEYVKVFGKAKLTID